MSNLCLKSKSLMQLLLVYSYQKNYDNIIAEGCETKEILTLLEAFKDKKEEIIQHFWEKSGATESKIVQTQRVVKMVDLATYLSRI